MSFLTPLYIAGLLAVSLPVVFHLIRRSPRGRFAFSSLMFLSPSPPRLTRRSRLDNLLLFLLRAVALGLLALAFARPFLRESALFGFDPIEGLTVAVLLDTSASMRRENLWGQALVQVDQALDDLGPGDDVALFTFDADVVARVQFNDAAGVGPKQHVAGVRARLGGLAPTWAQSNLGEALIAVAEELHQRGEASWTQDAVAETVRQIVLVSDLQEGSHLDALRTYQWPNDVQLEFRTVAPAATSNASLHLAADPGGEHGQEPQARLRIRVANDRLSSADRFELRWESENPLARQPSTEQSGATGVSPVRPRKHRQDAPATPPSVVDEPPGSSAEDPVRVSVPPGESRVVRVPCPAEDSAARCLVLSGDEHPFDNTLYLAPVKQEEVTLLYVGSDAADDVQGLRYYLERAFPETPQRKVLLVVRKPDALLTPDDLGEARLIVVGEAVPEERAAQLKQYIADGGAVFYVLTDAAAGESLGRIMGIEELITEEAPTDDYAMLGELRFTHPLLAVFANPRFNDFTRIHFWKHRRVKVDDVAGLDVLARFDNGDPALFEQRHEKGRLLVLSSGWHPDDSQLARSSKFVPLVSRVLEQSGRADTVLPQYEIGDRVELGALDEASAP
ncbi:MAG: BatA domain-containing protein, partial [Planctomycetota bacterium]